MNFKGKFILFLCTIIFITTVDAQDDNKNVFLKHAVVAAKIGTYGPGVDVQTSLLPNLKARIGFNYLSSTYKDDLNFTANDIVVENNEVVVTGLKISGSLSNPKLDFPNFNVLLDFYPVKSGKFFITAGFYIGNNHVKAKGWVDEYRTGEKFEFDDIIIVPNEDGSFNLDLKLGNVVKPYVGIGIEPTFNKSRFGLRFNAGIIHQGSYQISSDNIYDPDNKLMNQVNEQVGNLDLPFSQRILRWWPLLSAGVTYRIF